MSDQVYDLSQYVEGLRRITREETDDKKILQRVAPLAQKFAATPGLIKDEFYDCDEEQGFSVYLLHEEKDHSNAVFMLAWLPDHGCIDRLRRHPKSGHSEAHAGLPLLTHSGNAAQ